MKKMIAVLIAMIVAMFVLTGCTITIEKVVHESQATAEVSE